MHGYDGEDEIEYLGSRCAQTIRKFVAPRTCDGVVWWQRIFCENKKQQKAYFSHYRFVSCGTTPRAKPISLLFQVYKGYSAIRLK